MSLPPEFRKNAVIIFSRLISINAYVFEESASKYATRFDSHWDDPFFLSFVLFYLRLVYGEGDGYGTFFLFLSFFVVLVSSPF